MVSANRRAASARRLFLVVAAALVAAPVLAAPVLGAAPPAFAHNYVISSTPAAGQTLTELPEVFEVTTNAPLLTLDGATNGFAFQVTDAAGRFYGTGCITVAGASISMPAALGHAGAYTATWQVISEDGHTVSGEIPFTWHPASSDDISTGSATAPKCANGGSSTGGNPGGSNGVTDNSTGSASPVTTKAADPTVPLGTVLWIGGAVVAVGLAVGIAIFIAGRQPKPRD